MNKIKNQARINEIGGIANTILRIYRADSSAQKDVYLKNVMAEVEDLSGRITTAILQDKVVSNLNKADDGRDEALKAFGALVSGYTAHPSEEKRASALSLKGVYDKYAKAGIVNASYTEESSMIESLLEELSSVDARANMAKLDGVSELLEGIRSAQDSFNTASDVYVKAKGGKAECASNFKKSLLSSLNNRLLSYLSMMSLTENASLAEFSRNLDSEIARLNENIAKHQKKGSDADKNLQQA
ncbi:DUF6261 family protein [Fibrobacter intestinalis]|uniref:Uncharacterized protein n=1 Tax=Fibrobacter intestinalis TaxID=28122 RepID=A0A1T4RST4_9BACT|nr:MULTISPECIES: DUF6261 family protein [Fibrobacter]PBC74534.1 hypothetical protein BGW94_2195 [Fibrobacter sp. NR9]SKA19044.1 hypothetical protein SAMN02745108_02831 [Fibrobacter intestinalis]